MTGFHDTPLAIVGMACRFPGSETLDEFWSLLRDGRSAITPLPRERLDQSLHFSSEKGAFAKTYCRFLGQVSQRPVDRSIIDIPDDVAARYDLTHLTLCEVAASACRNAGYDPRRLPYRNTGVYLGNSSVGDLEGDVTYHQHANQLAGRLRRVPQFAALPQATQTRVLSDVAEAVRTSCPNGANTRVRSFAAHTTAGLIASLFGTHGPALVSDAACAASFTALHLAARALHLGTIDMAIVGAGACRSWAELIFLSLVQAMSGTGSRPFDADADGLIAADGYGALVVKTLPRALHDGDNIVGVLRGVGLSSDGKGKGFWAPLPEGQMLCMRRALGDVDPSRIQYVHCHATSTQLGDATEMQSLNGVYGPSLRTKIPVTSVKANIGHTLETAGMAGLIATLLAMKHETIPPAANFRTPNPEIPWDSIPFFPPTKALPWPKPDDGGPRRAVVNAFGIGGLNTNVVIDDVPETIPRRNANGSTHRGANGSANRGAGPQARTSAASFNGKGDGHTHDIADSVRSNGAVGHDASANGHEAHPLPVELLTAGPLGATDGDVCDDDGDADIPVPMPIAVVGVGCVLPGAFDVASFRTLLATDHDPKTPVPAERWDSALEPHLTDTTGGAGGQPRGGFLAGYEFDWKRHRIPPFQVANSNPLQFVLLDAADQAFRDAGLDARPHDKARVVTLVGTVFTNDFCADVHLGVRLPEFTKSLGKVMADARVPAATIETISREYQTRFLKDRPGALDDTGAYSSSTLASRVAKQLDFGGGAMTIDAGDASGLAALASAVDLLRTGQASLVMCCGGQRNLDVTRYNQLARSAAERGDVPAEGAVAFVLKRLDDALRDGDPIRAVVRDVRFGADPHDAAAAAARAISLAAGPEIAGIDSMGQDSSVPCLTEGEGAACSVNSRFGHLQGGASLVDLLARIVRFDVPAETGRPTSANGRANTLAGDGPHHVAVVARMSGGFADPTGAVVAAAVASPSGAMSSRTEVDGDGAACRYESGEPARFEFATAVE